MQKSHMRHQIFVSSTYKDLIDERQAAVEAILRAGHVPAGMELFAAENKPQMEVIQDWIEESDIFCLILGGRYGSIEPTSGKSYVECEYDHALKVGKPIFSLVLDEQRIEMNVKNLGHKVALEQDNGFALKAFRTRITNTLVRMVSSPDSIKVAVFEAIASLERKYEIDGWVRAKDARVSPQLSEELARLSAENARLTKELQAAKAAREERIEGRTAREWGNILAQYNFRGWDPEAKKPSDTVRLNLFDALLKYGHHLGAGVSNSYNDSDFARWLFNMASMLEAVGLAEMRKVPPSVAWQRLGFSAVGKRLFAALIAQNGSDHTLMSMTEVMRLLANPVRLRALQAIAAGQNASGSDAESPAPPGGPADPVAVAPPASPKRTSAAKRSKARQK